MRLSRVAQSPEADEQSPEPANSGEGTEENRARRRFRSRFVNLESLGIHGRPRIMLEANDSAIDDLFDMAEAFGIDLVTPYNKGDDPCNSESGSSDGDEEPYLKLNLEKMTSDGLREIARRLLELAESTETGDQASGNSVDTHSVFFELFTMRARELAASARQIQLARAVRSKHISPEILGEPAWDMLLELFCQFATGKPISTKSLSYVSGSPASTALRYILELEKIGYIRKDACETDKRVSLISLTPKGAIAMGRFLTDVID